MRKILGWMVMGIAFWSSAPVLADHDDGTGTIQRLDSSSRQLDQEVMYSALNYTVKGAVRRFTNDVSRLVQCANSSPLHSWDHEGGGCPAACRYDLDRARSSSQSVDRYLYDSSYDYPQVYRVYMETKDALQDLQVGPGPGPGPGPSLVTCTARDTGWEEHGGGHVGYGYNSYAAQQQALQECRRYHSSCIIQSCH